MSAATPRIIATFSYTQGIESPHPNREVRFVRPQIENASSIEALILEKRSNRLLTRIFGEALLFEPKSTSDQQNRKVEAKENPIGQNVSYLQLNSLPLEKQNEVLQGLGGDNPQMDIRVCHSQGVAWKIILYPRNEKL